MADQKGIPLLTQKLDKTNYALYARDTSSRTSHAPVYTAHVKLFTVGAFRTNDPTDVNGARTPSAVKTGNTQLTHPLQVALACVSWECVHARRKIRCAFNIQIQACKTTCEAPGHR